ncbi:MAG: polysulfide reductase NrfD [Magnetococcales bacterium]|nr:polysulfide reductase NrfD [Magnetococcales bacterium]
MSKEKNSTKNHNKVEFILASLIHCFKGGWLYWGWMLSLIAIVVYGAMAYGQQARYGLSVTGLSDQITWGLYIGNFTFFVGVAAAAVILVIPAYLLHRNQMRRVTILGESLAVAAVIVAMLFVTADLGQPLRFWHALPLLGKLNFPTSILAWDIVVLALYLLVNLIILWYLLYNKFCHKSPVVKRYFPVIVVAIILGLSIHTVTAFMLSGNPSRPFWHTAILAPRFIASAFAAGAALMIILFQILHITSKFRLSKGLIREIALIMVFAQFFSLFLLGAEIYTAFYHNTAHDVSAHLLFTSNIGHDNLTLSIYLAIAAGLSAFSILMVRRFRENVSLLNIASILIFFAVWSEKGLGLVIPGFVPTPLGEMAQYTPSTIEIKVAIAIWAVGAIIFTLLAKVAIAIEFGGLRLKRPVENTDTEI